MNTNRFFFILRSGVGGPKVNECEGEYHYDNRKNMLLWQLPVIDSSNKSGSMEFSMDGHPDDFFPVTVSFVSKKSYCDIQVRKQCSHLYRQCCQNILNLKYYTLFFAKFKNYTLFILFFSQIL